MHNFKNLKVWQKSMELAKNVLSATNQFPNEEKYGISSQIRRCVISIPSNIAEGSARGSDKEFRRFLSISLGSSFELETQLLLIENMNYIDQNKMTLLLNDVKEIQKMTTTLIEKFS